MATEREHYIAHGLIRVVLQYPDKLGYFTDLRSLATYFRQWLPDIGDHEIVDAMKRLVPQYLTLLKWSNGHRRSIEYPTGIQNDEEFFYQGTICLRQTPYTRRRLHELTALFSVADVEPPKKTNGSGGRGAT